MKGKKITYEYTVYHNSGIPFMGKFKNLENPTDLELWCEIITHRYLSDDKRELVQRGFLLCGFTVENAWNFVENGWKVLQVIHKPTKISELPTDYQHIPFCKTL